MQRKDRRNEPQAAWVVVFVIFAASGIWFFHIGQPFGGVLYILTSFILLSRAFRL